MEHSLKKIQKAWMTGNHSLMKSMGENYYFLDDNELGTAMVIDNHVIDAIKQSLSADFGTIESRTLTPLAKSIASGTYFEEIGKPTPKLIRQKEEIHANSNIVRVNEFEKEHAQKELEIHAKAKQTGRGNPIFQKLIPSDLNGKYMGKTGKFIIEYPINANVAELLRTKTNEIADFVDEQLGNEEYDGNTSRIFVSDELKKENTSVCALMYHGIEGEQNKEISAAVKSAVRDIVPYSMKISIGKTYSVLNTELKQVQDKESKSTSKIKSLFSTKSEKNILNESLNERLLSNQPSYEQACFSL